MQATIQVITRSGWHWVVALALLLGLPMSEALAVFTWGALGSPRSLTLQIGSNNSTVNKVTFDVFNDQVAPNASPITGVPDTVGTITPTIANSVDIRIATVIRSADAAGVGLYLKADSSVGLTCVAGSGCGSTVIPFNTISWTAYAHDATYPTLDIQNGTFNGGSQTLINVIFSGQSISMAQSLVFAYANATVYPAGQYTGQVVYTVTMP